MSEQRSKFEIYEQPQISQAALLQALREFVPEMPEHPEQIVIRFEQGSVIFEFLTRRWLETCESREESRQFIHGLRESLRKTADATRKQKQEPSPAQLMRADLYRQTILVIALVFAGLMLWMSFVANCTQ